MPYRAGELWYYRVAEGLPWHVFVVLESDYGPDIMDYCQPEMHHKTLYIDPATGKFMQRNMTESLLRDNGKWDNNPNFLQRIA